MYNKLSSPRGSHLDAAADISRLIRPSSIAVIGASERSGTIGWRLSRELIASGLGENLALVNPRQSHILGRPAFAELADVPFVPDVVIVAVRANQTPAVLAECSRLGAPFAIIVSGGFTEGGGSDDLQEELLTAASSGGIRTRIVGPNAEGIHNVLASIPMSFTGVTHEEFTPLGVRHGDVAMVAQSGGVAYGVWSHAMQVGLGFNYIISTGNEADLTIVDFLDWLIDEGTTRVICLFIEGLADGQRFIEAAKKARERGIAILAGKVGTTQVGAQAALSHTGHLVGEIEAYRAAYRECGVIEAMDQRDMIDMATALSGGSRTRGDRVGIVSISGGAGGWAADRCDLHGLSVPRLSSEAQLSIGASLPKYASTTNPVDIAGEGSGGTLEALRQLASSGEVDIILFILSGIGSGYPPDTIVGTVSAIEHDYGIPVLLMSTTAVSLSARNQLSDAGICVYESGDQLARAAETVVRHSRGLTRLEERAAEPAPFPPAMKNPTTSVASAEGTSYFLEPGQESLCEYQAKAILRAEGVPIPGSRMAQTKDGAIQAGFDLGFPLVVKLQAPSLLHKSEAGGVVVGITDMDALVGSVTQLFNKGALIPDFHGVLVEQMVEPVAEMIVGTKFDEDFGPLVMVGVGGVFAEVLGDRAVRLAPVTEAEAKEMIEELKGVDLLRGARGRPHADVAALCSVIASVSAFAARDGGRRIKEIDVNPVAVMVQGGGACALDALIVG